MTTILGYQHSADSPIFLAADGLVQAGARVITTDEEKIRQVGGWLVAVSGETGSWAALSEAMCDSAVLTPAEIAKRLRSLLAEGGWEFSTSPGSGPRINAGFILARAGELWEIWNDFSVEQVRPGRLAFFGSGSEFAAGAFHALGADYGTELSDARWLDTMPQEAMRRAMIVAMKCDTSTGGRDLGAVAAMDGAWQVYHGQTGQTLTKGVFAAAQGTSRLPPISGGV